MRRLSSLAFLLSAIFIVGVSTMAEDAGKSADTIFLNGDIYTQAKPARVQALAVRDGRIMAIGSNEDVQKLKGTQTQVIDLDGHFVMPGFNDAHSHLAAAGMRHLEVDLTGSANLPDMQHRIGLKVNKTEPGEWIVGSGWDHTLWLGQTLPTRQDIDVMTNGHPAIFVRIDGHIAIANTAALEAAGITDKTAAPQGGKIDVDRQGQPTGILRESAQGLVFQKVPPPTPAQRRAAAEASLADAARWGVTSAQDCSQWEDFLVYEDLEREGKLTLRISEWLRFNDPLDTVKQQRAHHSLDDPILHTGMLKGYMDGSLGSRTAALLAPYSDDPGNAGLPQYQQPELNHMATERMAAGFQLGFHAIGDRAAQMALDAFRTAESSPQARAAPGATTPKDFRLRIEHDQVIAPNQFALYNQLGVIASVQPSHLLTDMNWAKARIGPERAKTSYPWKQFGDNGVKLAFGTDYPVEPINPFRGVYAAITRKNEAGTKEYFPEQEVTIEQALAAYTTGSAYAEFAEKQKGTLAPGMLADFVVLDRDLTKVAPAGILKTQVLRTVMGGRTVYEAAR
ncbi:MAG TPA: amidohydrolase [Terriglobales bacterium]